MNEQPNEEPIPRAVTTEEGGEISCSVEETNRIRAQLGLPPLEMDDNKPTTEDSQKDEDGFVFIDHSKILEEERLRQKLEKSRQDRERDEMQNLKGKSLGDLLSEESKGLDVKAWVSGIYRKQSVAGKKQRETRSRIGRDGGREGEEGRRARQAASGSESVACRSESGS